MEVKINREIREYTESMYFGLSLRQFIFSVLACVVAIAAYFVSRPLLGLEVASWLCVIVAFPFAVMGFVKYNGMPAEKFFIAWFKSEFLIPKRLTFRNSNVYYNLLEEGRKAKRKERRKNDKNTDNNI